MRVLENQGSRLLFQRGLVSLAVFQAQAPIQHESTLLLRSIFLGLGCSIRPPWPQIG
jgi:hypothetical protein